MRILVLGCSGPIGQAIVAAAQRAGNSVVGASRAASGGPDRIALNRSRTADVLEAVKSLKIDVVVDVIAYTLDDTLPLLHGLADKVGRYVLVSSCDVYRNYGLLHRKEAGQPVAILSEDAPLRISRFPYRGAAARSADDPARWMDDYDKIPIEHAVQRMGCDWTILRLPMVYGPGERQRRFSWLLRPILDGARKLDVPSSWANWTTTYGFVENVGAAVSLASIHSGAARAVFNVADHPTVTHLDWIERFRIPAGWRGEVAVSDDDTLPLARATENLDLSVPLIVNATRCRDRLGFDPPIALSRALAATIAEES